MPNTPMNRVCGTFARKAAQQSVGVTTKGTASLAVCHGTHRADIAHNLQHKIGSQRAAVLLRSCFVF